MTPFEATYGRKPPSPITYAAGQSQLEAVDSELQTRENIWEHLRANLSKSQQKMKSYADQGRKEITFAVGDQVLLKLHPYRQLSLGRRSSQKLALRYYGPFEVLEKVGQVAYRLHLPPSSRLHPVFHVSLLKPFHPNTSYQIHTLPPEYTSVTPPLKPQAILATRHLYRHNSPITQVLVQWEHSSPENSTWEDEKAVLSLLNNTHPPVQLPLPTPISASTATSVSSNSQISEHPPSVHSKTQSPIFSPPPHRDTTSCIPNCNGHSFSNSCGPLTPPAYYPSRPLPPANFSPISTKFPSQEKLGPTPLPTSSFLPTSLTHNKNFLSAAEETTWQDPIISLTKNSKPHQLPDPTKPPQTAPSHLVDKVFLDRRGNVALHLDEPNFVKSNLKDQYGNQRRVRQIITVESNNTRPKRQIHKPKHLKDFVI